MSGDFQLPIAFDLGATIAFALSGALTGVRRGYDLVGVFFLGFACGVGGSLIRDCLFLRNGPPVALTNPRYLLAVVAACAAGVLVSERMRRFERWILLVDALGLGAYAVVGTQKTLQAGWGVPAALLIGVLNATGGGLLRDVLTRQEPYVFKPGEFYALVALAGAVCFTFLTIWVELPTHNAALIAIAATFLLRLLTVRFNWRTRAVAPAVTD